MLRDAPTQSSNINRIRELTLELTGEEIALYLFFKISPDLFCIADRRGALIRVNDAWEKTLGWTNEELLSGQRQYTQLLHPGDVERTLDIILTMQQQPVTFNNRCRRKPGTVNRIIGESVAADNDYVILEWSAMLWEDNYIYAAARQLPATCFTCPMLSQRLNHDATQ